MQQQYDIIGMTCSACSSHVEKTVTKLKGMQQVNVNLLLNKMTVKYDEELLSSDEIVQAIDKAGYEACPLQESGLKPESARVSVIKGKVNNMKMRLIISFVFTIPLFYISMGHMMGLPIPNWLHGNENALIFAFLQFLLCLPVLFVNRSYFQNGFKTLFHGVPNMDSLIAIGSSAAIVYGIVAIFTIGWGLGHNITAIVSEYSRDLYFESAAMILTLITLGKFLETRSKGKTGEAIAKLIDLSPKTAIVERDEIQQEIPVEQVEVNDVIIVKPGQCIPVDGVIIDGSSTVDESALTGESIPVFKQVGNTVMSASINKTGAFKFTVTRVGKDTTLAQIISLVENAANSKAPISKLADKVSGVFVPIVIAIAIVATIAWLIAGYSVTFALSIGIAVLVISCPCALGLATPVAIMVGTGKGAENGILIKSAESLEIAHKIKTIVLDKTGTITQGKPRVTDIVCADDIEQSQLLHIAATLEKQSEHPLAEAIISEAKRLNINTSNSTDFNSITGKGVFAKIDAHSYCAGNVNMLIDSNVPIAEWEKKARLFSEQGKTPLYFADLNEKMVIGLIAVADTLKPTAKLAVKRMKALNIDVVMLTGDNLRTAEAIRKEVGIDTVIAQLLPQDKEREIATIQSSGKKVIMIGDGINDAPALTRADVGIAIGAGTDIAIDAADIVLMKSDLLDAVTAIELSHAVIKNIKQNLFWALFYNSVGIPLAAGVLFPLFGLKLNPMFAAGAMSLSSICVVLNALRLRWFHPKVNKNINNKKEEKSLIRKMIINGMSCSHCCARVEKALNAIEGVNSVVNLEGNFAQITSDNQITDETLCTAVTNAGYEVVSIEKLS